MNSLRDCPFQLFGIHPPYERFRQLTPSALAGESGVPGFIILFDIRVPVHGVDCATAELSNWIGTVRRAAPWAPLVARLPQPIEPSTFQFSTVALRAGARAVLARGESVLALRLMLTDVTTLAGDMVAWLGVAIPGVSNRTRGIVGSLICAGMQTGKADEALLMSGQSERTARRRLAWARLPSAGHLIRLGGILPLVLDLQRRWDDPVASVTHDHGLTTRVARDRLARLLGTTPTGLRCTIGWEWWIYRLIARGPHCGTQQQEPEQSG